LCQPSLARMENIWQQPVRTAPHASSAEPAGARLSGSVMNASPKRSPSFQAVSSWPPPARITSYEYGAGVRRISSSQAEGAKTDETRLWIEEEVAYVANDVSRCLLLVCDEAFVDMRSCNGQQLVSEPEEKHRAVADVLRPEQSSTGPTKERCVAGSPSLHGTRPLALQKFCTLVLR